MALYAISDLHLALNVDKPMDIFGGQWYKHEEKIKENWIEKIKEEDTVLIAGDISWSMRMIDGINDLNWINNLPGRKILIKGNHDYWWGSISKLNSLFKEMCFIQNNFFAYEEYAVCGSRGWTLSTSENFSAQDEKIFNRELIRLRLSLDEAVKAGYKKIIVMIHYPPIEENRDETEFTKIFKEYGVEKVIYGHIHGPALNKVVNGLVDEIQYINTSCDYINFNPVKIL